MHFTPLLMSGLAVVATATPTKTGPRLKPKNYLDKFDTLGLLEGIVPGLSPVTDTSDGNPGALHYSAWEFSRADPLVLQPASSPAIIVSGVDAQAREGQPAFSLKSGKGECFDLNTISYTCFLNSQNSLASIVQTCTIRISAMSGGESVEQDLIYNKNGVLAKMGTAKVSGFKCVKQVNVAITSALTGNSPVLASPGLDNIGYTTYTKA